MAEPEGEHTLAKAADYTASRIQRQFTCADGQHDYVYQGREYRVIQPYSFDVYYCRRCADRRERAV